MIKTVFAAIASSSRTLFGFWRALLILALLYGAMLAAIYEFFATREATAGELLLSLILAVLPVVFFFVLQTLAARFIEMRGHAKSLIFTSLRDFWKLLLVSLPLIAVIGGLAYLLSLVNVGPEQPVLSPPPRSATTKPAPIHWPSVALAATQYLLLYLILPLVLIHFWIVTSRGGVTAAVKTAGRTLARALGSPSVLTYVIGFLFFGVAPYFLLFHKTEASSTWIDIGLFSGRLALAVLMSLIAWTITVGALVELNRRQGQTTLREGYADVPEGPEHAPAGP